MSRSRISILGATFLTLASQTVAQSGAVEPDPEAIVAEGETRLGVIGVTISGEVKIVQDAAGSCVVSADLRTGDESSGVTGHVRVATPTAIDVRVLWASRALSMYQVEDGLLVVDRPSATADREMVRVRDVWSGLTLLSLHVPHADAGHWAMIDFNAIALSLALFRSGGEPTLSAFLASAWSAADGELASFSYRRDGAKTECSFTASPRSGQRSRSGDRLLGRLEGQ